MTLRSTAVVSAMAAGLVLAAGCSDGQPQPVDIPFVGAAPTGRSLLVVLRGR